MANGEDVSSLAGDFAGVASAMGRDVLVELSADPRESRGVEQERGEARRGALEESPSHRGVPNQHPAIAGEHGHAAEGEVWIDGERLGREGGLVDEGDSAEPVQGAEDGGGTSAEPAFSVVEADVPMESVRGHAEL